MDALTFFQIILQIPVAYAQSSGGRDENFLSSLLPMLGILIFMIWGFFAAFQIIGIVLSPAIKGAKRFQKLGKDLGKKGWQSAKHVAKFVGRTAALETAGAVGAVKGAKKALSETKEDAGLFKKIGAGMTGAIKGGVRGVATPAGRAEGKKAIQDIVAKTPLGKTPWYRRHKKPVIDTKESEEVLDAFTNEDLKNIASGKSFTRKGLQDQMAAIKLLAKKGDFNFDSETEEKLIRQAQNLGVDISSLTDSRPDLAPLVKKEKYHSLIKENLGQGLTQEEAEKKAAREIISETLAKMNPRQVRDNIKPKALENLDVVLGLDERKLSYLGTNGSTAQNEAILKTIRQNAKQIIELKDKFTNQGDTASVEKLERLLAAVGSNPNFSKAKPTIITSGLEEEFRNLRKKI